MWCSVLFADENNQNIGAVIAFNNNLHNIDAGKNESITSLEYWEYFPFYIGFEYTYDWIKLKYLLNHLSCHDVDLAISNNKFVLLNEFYYRKGKSLTKTPFAEEGPGWSDDYENVDFKDVTSYRYTCQFGYIFTMEIWKIHKLSYNSMFLQNEYQEKDGLAIGILTSVVYNYSSLQSDQYLLPEGEREYYTNCSTYKGDSVHSYGLQFIPMVNIAGDGRYFGFGFTALSIPFREGDIFCDKDQEIDEGLYFFTSLFAVAGVTTENNYYSLQYNLNSYKQYSLGVKDVDVLEVDIELELHAGIRF